MLACSLGLWLICSLIAVVAMIGKYKQNPALSLIFISYIFGLGVNQIGLLLGNKGPIIENLNQTITSGFGSVMTSIGLVIIFGTLIGKSLEVTQATEVIAQKLISVFGLKRPEFLMSALGWITSIPVFCDSGYVILSSIKKSLIEATKRPAISMSVALSTGLYASHTFVPPTPGPIAAASNLGIAAENLLWVMLLGGLVSLVAAWAGYLWATSSYVKNLSEPMDSISVKSNQLGQVDNHILAKNNLGQPSLTHSVLPLLIPIILMSVSAFSAAIAPQSILTKHLVFVGHPVVALIIGFLWAYGFLLRPLKEIEKKEQMIKTSLRDASEILIITASGGALGSVIKATPIAQTIQSLLGVSQSISPQLGLCLIFLVSALLKTAQGSTTAALVITSSIAMPLLPVLGLDQSQAGAPMGALMAMLAVCAGGMVVSHINDSYFWVVSQFSGMSVRSAYRSHTLATLWQGLAAFLTVLGLSLIFL